MKKKKFLSLLLSLTTAGSIISVPVYADKSDMAENAERQESRLWG